MRGKRTGGYRLIVNLKPLNMFFEPPKFKYETLNILRLAPSGALKGMSLDLKDGYFHFEVHPSLARYMMFNIAGVTY